MQISEQYDFFDDETSPVRNGNLPSVCETENKLKNIKKYYEGSILERATEILEKTKGWSRFFETEQKIN